MKNALMSGCLSLLLMMVGANAQATGNIDDAAQSSQRLPGRYITLYIDCLEKYVAAGATTEQANQCSIEAEEQYRAELAETN